MYRTVYGAGCHECVDAGRNRFDPAKKPATRPDPAKKPATFPMNPATHPKPAKKPTTRPVIKPNPGPIPNKYISTPQPIRMTVPQDTLPILPIGSLPAAGIPPAGSYVVNTLKDFGFIDEPDVFPKGAAPNIQNITQIAPGIFNFYLRHRGDPWSSLNPHGTKGAWYDGDSTGDWNTGKRDGQYHDKSRAECSSWVGKPKGFPEIVVGGTYDIATTVRLNPDFMPSDSYTMVMQPVFDLCYLSVSGDPTKSNAVGAELGMFGSGGTSGSSRTVTAFDLPRGQWTSLIMRLTVGKTGSIKMSVNGGAFKGLDHVDTTNRRSGHPMSIKIGLYSAATTGANRKPLPDQQVQHANVYVHRIA